MSTLPAPGPDDGPGRVGVSDTPTRARHHTPARGSTSASASPTPPTPPIQPSPYVPRDDFARSPFDVLEALETADLTPRQKELVIHVVRRAFRPSPHDPRRDSPWAKWVLLDGPTLARRFDDEPSHLSEALVALVHLRVLARGAAPNHRYVRPLAPRAWASEITNADLVRAARRARATRAGAGTPKQVRERQPGVPLRERTTDAFRREFLAEDTIRNWIAAGEGICDPALLAGMWPVVRWFQEKQDEAFKIKWLPRLQSLVTTEGWQALDLIRTLHALKASGKARWLWSYFVKTIDNPDTSAPQHAPASTAVAAAYTPTTMSSASSASSATGHVAASSLPTEALREISQERPIHVQDDRQPRPIATRLHRTPAHASPAAPSGSQGDRDRDRDHGDLDDFVERPGRGGANGVLAAGARVVDAG